MSTYDFRPTTLQHALAGLRTVGEALGMDEKTRKATITLGFQSQPVTVLLTHAATFAEHDYPVGLIAAVELGTPSGSIILKDLGRQPKLVFKPTQANATANTFTPVLAAINQAFPEWNHAAAMRDLLGPALADQLSHWQLDLSKLSDAMALGAEALSHRLVELGDRYAEMDKVARAREAEREEAARARLAAREELLEQRKAELDRRAEEMDAIDARAARRRHLSDLRTLLEQRSTTFSLTKETAEKRRPILWACLALGITFVGAAWWHLREKSDLHVALSAASAIGAIATAWYFIRWQNQWFDWHAQEEFRLKRLDLDIIRASWLVELAMEYLEVNKEALPQEMFDQLARNMFVDPNLPAPVVHPAEDALRALMGMSTRVKVGPGGNEFEIAGASAEKALKRGAAR